MQHLRSREAIQRSWTLDSVLAPSPGLSLETSPQDGLAQAIKPQVTSRINNEQASNYADEDHTTMYIQVGRDSPTEVHPRSIEELETWQSQDYTSLTFQHRQLDDCTNDCFCLCHTLRRSVQRFRTSQFLESLLGYLFASYSGLSFLRPGCSTPTCRKNSSVSFRLTYRFPRWAFAAAIHVAAGLTTFGDPSATILVQRRVRDTEENGLMELVRKGDCGGIKTLLLKRVASPSDADSDHGHTALHVSYSSRCRQDLRRLTCSN